MPLHLLTLSFNDISWITVAISASIIIYIIVGKYFLINMQRSADFSAQHYMVGVISTLSICCALLNLTIMDKVYMPISIDEKLEDVIVIPQTWQKPKDLTPPPLPDKEEKVSLPTPVIKIVPAKLIKETITAMDFLDEQQPDEVYNLDSMIQSTKARIPEIIERPDDEILFIPEQMPRFPGCEGLGLTNEEKHICSEKQLMSFIYKNVKYPQIDKEYRNEGTVIIRFVVANDGNISDIKIMKDVGMQCGQEAMRVVQLMNEMQDKWIPGKQRGRAVNVQFTLPIRFKLL